MTPPTSWGTTLGSLSFVLFIGGMEVGLSYFPFFACLSSEFQLVSSILGFGYSLTWFVVTVLQISQCPHGQFLGRFETLVFYWPSLLCLGFLLGRFLHMFLKALPVHLGLEPQTFIVIEFCVFLHVRDKLDMFEDKLESYLTHMNETGTLTPIILQVKELISVTKGVWVVTILPAALTCVTYLFHILACYRRAFHNFNYFLFFYNVLLGLGACLSRLLISCLLGTWLIARIDRTIMQSGYEGADMGFGAWIGMLFVDHYHTNPVLVSFCHILITSHKDRKLQKTVKYWCLNQSAGPRFSARARTRWFLLQTLINNPRLVMLRKSKSGHSSGEFTQILLTCSDC